jgi:hypothetical protein
MMVVRAVRLIRIISAELLGTTAIRVTLILVTRAIRVTRVIR